MTDVQSDGETQQEARQEALRLKRVRKPLGASGRIAKAFLECSDQDLAGIGGGRTVEEFHLGSKYRSYTDRSTIGGTFDYRDYGRSG